MRRLSSNTQVYKISNTQVVIQTTYDDSKQKESDEATCV